MQRLQLTPFLLETELKDRHRTPATTSWTHTAESATPCTALLLLAQALQNLPGESEFLLRAAPPADARFLNGAVTAAYTVLASGNTMSDPVKTLKSVHRESLIIGMH